ncbi:MAG: hypothetical protein Q8P93_01675 [bacterium]|nr:hypothetical protein [bacterium]
MKDIQFDSTPSVEDRIWAALMYIPPWFILGLLLFSDRPFVYAHTKQNVALYSIAAIMFLAIRMLWIFGVFFLPLVFLVLFFLWLVGFAFALFGKEEVPFLNTIAEKLPFKV